MEYTTIVAAPACVPGRLQVPRALHRLGHRPALDVPGPARPDRLRRPVQAGRGLPHDLAAAASPAGPRGLPRRRLLPALPAAGALRQALRRARRRLDDRPADHRDQGQRRLGLHPDQRHLDHRRPDLPRDRPVQLRASGRPSTSASRSPGSVARPRSRRCARWPARCGSTWRSTASWRPSPPSAPTSTRRPRPSSSAAPAWSSCSSSRSTRRSRSSARSSRSGPAPPASSTTSRSATSAGSRPTSSTSSPGSTRASTPTSSRPGCSPTRSRSSWSTRSRTSRRPSRPAPRSARSTRRRGQGAWPRAKRWRRIEGPAGAGGQRWQAAAGR